ILLALLGIESPYVFAIWFGMLVVGIVYYEVRKRYLLRNGTDIRKLVKEHGLGKEIEPSD
ncbi:MAG: hypothetical protein SV377_00825, partial [Halobacteria archaeon]|nr:hypothetical protein [Halobacteria archaeon]